MDLLYKILYLEMDPALTLLVSKELEKSNYNFKIEVVKNEDAFKEALLNFAPDVVLSDEALTYINCLNALCILKKTNLKIPFIAIAPSITKPFAMALLKEAATDYILKNHLQRLPFAIINAIQKYQFEEEGLQTFQNIKTQEALATATLQQSETKLLATVYELKKIMNSSLDIICTSDEEGKIINISAAVETILGYTPKELIGKKLSDLVFQEDIEKSIITALAVKNGQPTNLFSNRLVHKNGSIVSILWSAHFDEKDKLSYSIGKNTQENRLYQKSIESDRKRIQDLFTQAPTSMGVLKGPTHIFESANPYLENLIGKTDVIGKTVLEVLPEVAAQGFLELLDNVYKTGETFQANEKLLKLDLNGDGELTDKYVNFIYQAYKNSFNKIEGIFFFVVEVTEQVISRKKIEESENRLREIFNTIPEALVIIDSQSFKFLDVNDTAVWKLKYSKKELLKMGPVDISSTYQKDGSLTKDIASKYISEMRAGERSIFEWVFLDAKGNEIWCEVRLSALYKNKDTQILCSISDISIRKENEQQMVDLNRRLILATKAAGMGIWDLNVINNHLKWDKSMLQMYDVEEAEFNSVYEDWLSRIHPEDKERVNEQIQLAIAGKKKYNTEFRIIKKDFSVRHIKAISISEKDVNGKIIRLVGVNWDITKEKEKTQELTLLESVITNTTDSVIITEANPKAVITNKIIYVNNAFTKMTGYTAEEVMGKTPQLLEGPNSDKEELNKLAEAIKNWQTYEATLVNYKKTGEEYWVNFSATPVADEKGNYTHWIAIEKDVTESKLAEIRLRVLNKKLQKHTQELAASNAELEQFAYIASHDLQEPLRMISSFLTLLDKKYNTLIDDKGKQYISFAVDGAQRMRQIILDLLEYSRAGTLEEEKEELDLNELLDEIQILLRKNIEEKQALIFIDKLPKIQAHRSPMRQVFQNLLTNALLYSKKEIHAVINIKVADLKNYWQFSISDNGIGIEKEYYDKIFIIFQRLHSKEAYKGTGMGLAITKKIIDRQGGKIWVTSQQGTGSTFHFTIKK